MTDVEIRELTNHALSGAGPGRVLHAVCQCQGVQLPTVALCGWVCTHEVRLSVADEDKCAVCLELMLLPRDCCGWTAP